MSHSFWQWDKRFPSMKCFDQYLRKKNNFAIMVCVILMFFYLCNLREMWNEKSVYKSKWRRRSSSLIVNSHRLLLLYFAYPINIPIHQLSRHVISTSACVFLVYTHIYLHPIMDRAMKLQLFDQILKCAKVIGEKFSSIRDWFPYDVL